MNTPNQPAPFMGFPELDDPTPKELEMEANADAVVAAVEGRQEYLRGCRPNFVGSLKQVTWAENIWESAIFHLACEVYEGNISQQRAAEIASNPEVRFWIDNRNRLDELK